VHLAVCEPLHREELEKFAGCTNPEFNKGVAELIDARIKAAYRLYPNNYIAADLLSGKRSYSYTEAEKETFVKHIDKITKEYPPELRHILLRIYANPVIG
jgi:hypothetical protein